MEMHVQIWVKRLPHGIIGLLYESTNVISSHPQELAYCHPYGDRVKRKHSFKYAFVQLVLQDLD